MANKSNDPKVYLCDPEDERAVKAALYILSQHCKLTHLKQSRAFSRAVHNLIIFLRTMTQGGQADDRPMTFTATVHQGRLIETGYTHDVPPSFTHHEEFYNAETGEFIDPVA